MSKTESNPKTSGGLLRSVTEAIGNTPLVQLERVVPPGCAAVYAKLESSNPGGSDRIALQMVLDAMKEGKVSPGSTVVEATSGNTGIGLSLVCASLGLKCVLVMPESMSIERRRILASRGAEVVLVPVSSGPGMIGAIRRAEEVARANGYFYADQFKNPSNVKAHTRTTGPEIRDAFLDADLKLDALVAGIGTGGTVTGCGIVLKEAFPTIKVVGVEPRGSPVLSGGGPGPHRIQGIGAGFVPRVLDREILDEVAQVGDIEAMQWTKQLAVDEGVFCGISGGAATKVAVEIAKELGPGKNVVVIIPDTGERYLSVK